MPQFIKFPVSNLKDFKNIKWRLGYKSKDRLPSEFCFIKFEN